MSSTRTKKRKRKRAGAKSRKPARSTTSYDYSRQAAQVQAAEPAFGWRAGHPGGVALASVAMVCHTTQGSMPPHSRPFRRLWTNTGAVHIFILLSPCPATLLFLLVLGQVEIAISLALARSRTLARYRVCARSYVEIAGDRGRSQSRPVPEQEGGWAGR